MYFLSIPIPSLFSLTANGLTMPNEKGVGWHVKVEIASPLFGFLVSYDGIVFIDNV